MATHCLRRHCVNPLHTEPYGMGAIGISTFRGREPEAWRDCYILEDTQYVNSRVGICAFNNHFILPS